MPLLLPPEVAETGLCGDTVLLPLAALGPCVEQYPNRPACLTQIRISFPPLWPRCSACLSVVSSVVFQCRKMQEALAMVSAVYTYVMFSYIASTVKPTLAEYIWSLLEIYSVRIELKATWGQHIL